MKNSNQEILPQESQFTQQPPPIKDKNIFKILFILSLVVVAEIVIAFYSVLNNKIQLNVNQNNLGINSVSSENLKNIPTLSESKTQKTNGELETIFNQIAGQLKNADSRVTLSNDEASPSVWWIDNDNLDILIPTDFSLMLSITAKNKSNESEEYNQVFDKLNKIVKEDLSKNGFTLNPKNSSKNKKDDRMFDYIQAYESENFICVTVSPVIEDSNFFKFRCLSFDQITLAREKQLPFLKILKANSTIDKNTDFVITSLKIVDDEAKANINFRRTGFITLFYQDNNGWRKIFSGQDNPMCDELSKNNIPAEHWPDCYLDQQGNIKKGSFKIKF